jgi:hypothetical protein
MGPVNLVAGCRKRVTLPPLFQWLAQERNWVRTHGSVSLRAVDYVGSSFPREQWLCPLLLMTSQKVAMYGDRPKKAYAWRTWTDVENVRVMLVGFSLLGVHRFESLRLSDISNRLFVTVFT